MRISFISIAQLIELDERKRTFIELKPLLALLADEASLAADSAFLADPDSDEGKRWAEVAQALRALTLLI